RPFGGVFDRYHAIVSPTPGYFIEYIREPGLRQVSYAVSEFTQRGLMRPGAGRAEVGDFQVLFVRQGGRHDFAVNGAQRFFRQTAGVLLEQTLKNGLLPLRGIDGESTLLFNEPDFMHQIRTL